MRDTQKSPSRGEAEALGGQWDTPRAQPLSSGRVDGLRQRRGPSWLSGALACSFNSLEPGAGGPLTTDSAYCHLGTRPPEREELGLS